MDTSGEILYFDTGVNLWRKTEFAVCNLQSPSKVLRHLNYLYMIKYRQILLKLVLPSVLPPNLF